jgi:hypothetical protein
LAWVATFGICNTFDHDYIAAVDIDKTTRN